MTDRELLERAARAAGVCLHPEEKLHRSYGNWGCDTTCMVCKKDPSTATFRPLTDYRDALWLAVELSIDVTFRFVGGQRCEALAPGGQLMVEPFDAPGCNGEATCRAIVRAAAAMAPEEAE